MFSGRARALPLLAALSLILVGLFVPAASATVTESSIAEPADPTFTLADTTAAPTNLTVTGTTSGSGNVDINCYTASGYTQLASNVVPAGNTFTTTISTSELTGGPCVLRAVPEGDTTEYPPGAASEFVGPRLANSSFEPYESSSDKVTYGYEYDQHTLTAYNEIEPLGDCGLDYSALYAPESLAKSEYLFDCNGALFLNDLSNTRSDTQIDGQNAYDPYAANELRERLKLAGATPAISVTKSFEPGSGDVTIHETDPMVKCPSNTFPPTEASCPSFVTTGVQLERTWHTSHSGQVLSMTDTWHSTDGAGHQLNALYYQSFVHVNGAPGGAFEFPGHVEFAEDTHGEKIALPSGANTILYKVDKATPEGGDLQYPQGALVYDSAPNEALIAGMGTNEANYDDFEMPYQRTIPAGGSNTLRMAYVQAYSLSEVISLAAEARSAYTAPSVSIGSPANGSTVSTPTVTVSGTASDAGGLSSVTVNGQTATLASDGTWSASVPLTVGSNTLTATATNDAGMTSTASATVDYAPVTITPPPLPPQTPHASQVGSASGANGNVTFGLACVGAAGTKCVVKVSLTTIEKLKGSSVRGVVARLRSKRVTLGTATLIVPAGVRIKVSLKLNALGRRLLAHFGKLPVHLSALLTTPGSPAKAVIAQNLTVKPAKKHKKHH